MTASPRPVFIFGVARSGTNLLARALDVHPRTTVALDPLMPLFRAWRNVVAAHLHLRRPFDPRSAFQDYYFDPDGPPLLDAMLDADTELEVGDIAELRVAVRERAALESAERAAVFAAWTGGTVAELFNDAFRLLASGDGTENTVTSATVVIKEVWTTEFARPLALAFPDARFLLIHRDPRAVLASLIELARTHPDQAAHTVSYMRHWRKNVAVSHRLANDPALCDRVTVVRYEDLVCYPARVLATIHSFLELPGLVDVMQSDGQAALPSNSSFKSAAGTGVDAAAVERWRTYLRPEIAATIDYHCEPEMRLLGYSPLGRTEPVSNEVLRYVEEAHRQPGKWRSDTGTPARDMAWEARRRALLNGDETDAGEIRRCFLFEDVYDVLAARQTTSQEVCL